MTVSSFVFTNAVGRVVEWHYQAYTQSSPQGLIIVCINRTSASDADMQDTTTLTDLLATAANEVTNTGYERRVLVRTGVGQLALPAISAYDSGNDRRPLDLPNQLYPTVASGGGAWTDAIICYAANTAGADSTLIPMTCNRFGVTPDGSAVNMTIMNYALAGRP